jgi:lipoprotein-anchoring transpeptidase ErfK/SrfK
MTNADVIDLYNRVSIGTKAVVLPMQTRSAAMR